MARRKKQPKLQPLPWNGDQGTGTQAATAGTVIEELDGPNRMARRRRPMQSDLLKAGMSQRQYQAAQAIEAAYERAQQLSSGGDSIGKVIDLQATVQSSPKPAATVAAQIDAVSRLTHIMSAVPKMARPVIEHLFWHQKPMRDFAQGKAHYGRSAEMKVALDLVANKLRY